MNRFLDERAIFPENLDAVVDTIADVHEAVIGNDDAIHPAELFRRRRRRVVRRHLRIVWPLTVGAPVPLVRAGVGVEDDDAPVPVAVRDIYFVGRRVGEDFRRLPEVLHVITAVMYAVLS